MTLTTSGEPKRERSGERSFKLRAPKSPEVEYRRALFQLNRLLKQQTNLINEMVKQGVPPSEAARRIEAALREANRQFDNVAQRMVPGWFNRMSELNKQKVQRNLRLALGVQTATIIDTPAIAQRLNLAVAENVQLIKTIPEQHFSKVARAVFDNYRGETFKEGSLIGRLRALGAQTDRRAKLIARDQTNKFIGSINEVRQQDVGIEEYIWRNVGDIRVTGTPGGPNQPTAAHGNHYEREGKRFRWDSPPADGHPGEPIQCRCFAEPIVNIEKVKANAIRT